MQLVPRLCPIVTFRDCIHVVPMRVKTYAAPVSVPPGLSYEGRTYDQVSSNAT